MKKYIPIVPTESENNLCLEVLYSKGGHNWFNGDNERRGYYLHCTPTLVKTDRLSNGTEYSTSTVTLGKGYKLMLKEVGRSSQKAEEEANRLAEEKEEFIVKEVCKRYDLELAAWVCKYLAEKRKDFQYERNDEGVIHTSWEKAADNRNQAYAQRNAKVGRRNNKRLQSV